MNNILELKGITKKYGGFTLDQVSFSLDRGYIMGFVGANGAGKTTTIHLILNMIKKDAGRITVFGLDNIQNEKEIKEKLGVVFDSTVLVGEWDLKEVEKSYQTFYSEWDGGTYRHYLDRFGLKAQMRVKDLSRGMSVKLMLAAAFSHNAELLVLDEPTSGLDPEARNELMTIFQEYVENGDKSILFSTHITGDLEKIADYITCIDNGRVYYTGAVDDLLNSYTLIKGAPNQYKGYEEYIIGLRSFDTGFEGLVPSRFMDKLGDGFQMEKPSIEDIVVCVRRGGKA